MDIKIDSLIPFDTLRTDLEHVFSVVEKNGKVVLLKNNMPAYILMKYDTLAIEVDTVPDKQINYTLQEAMAVENLYTHEVAYFEKFSVLCLHSEMIR